jgi:hypothetical protein
MNKKISAEKANKSRARIEKSFRDVQEAAKKSSSPEIVDETATKIQTQMGTPVLAGRSED